MSEELYYIKLAEVPGVARGILETLEKIEF